MDIILKFEVNKMIMVDIAEVMGLKYSTVKAFILGYKKNGRINRLLNPMTKKSIWEKIQNR